MRTRQEALDKIEVRARIRELFNLADPNYVRLSDIEHAFKLDVAQSDIIWIS